ncbi:heavy-metal-associated domain-containing protein [Skermania sp. ID1734]|uniref:heavy-metal-associated domain-containing protein n=1 Tax=Skermania sp. ID1734 TaxID=2597516 RepID=UPI00117ED673|nr:heavy metal-associated domain-containing protein [Skermania sp. ID1734]TSD93785.1 heavy-metal-associated domain-containing protein [Skermania sp. ID1734]
MSETTTTTATVTGMTCSHCAASVSEEIHKIPGVTGVNVDLATGRVTIDSSSPVDRTSLAEAIEEAGYQLAE